MTDAPARTETSECAGCGRAVHLTEGKVLTCLLCGAKNRYGQDIDNPKP
jgi:hypothetical protein